MNKAPVILLPIESFPERYSMEWLAYFIDFMAKNKIPYQVIDPDPLTKEIEVGEFLDVLGTNWYKMRQLEMVISGIHNGSIPRNARILLLDGWFPGIETLFYIRDALQAEFRVYGCLHAGTWDEWDFLSQKGMGDWAKRIEKSWISHYWKSFVATDFHKKLINTERSRKREKGKVKVTGFPFYWEKRPISLVPREISYWHTKENICVFPHRLATEKNVPGWKTFVDSVIPKTSGWKYLCTKLECKTKEEYFKLLGRSKIAISTAYQETWGIAMQEAVYSGCIPLVPDRLSYKELYPAELRYSDEEELAEKFLRIIKDLEAGNDAKWSALRRECEASLRLKNESALQNIFKEMGYLE